jgi:protein-tyrosine phosphatase
MEKKVLFLGVTNHCASRFAEIMFNHIASEQLLNFYSVSRGVMTGHPSDPIDPRTFNALKIRGIPMSANLRKPKTLRVEDLKVSSHIVLVSGSELSPRIARAKHIEGKEMISWNFNNAGSLSPSQLFPALEAEVYLLVRRLQQRQLTPVHISA